MRLICGKVEFPVGKALTRLFPAVVSADRPGFCVCCGEPFSAVRKRRARIRVSGFILPLCGRCRDRYRRGGQSKELVLEEAKAFCEGWKDGV
jgi:hypothetical protein